MIFLLLFSLCGMFFLIVLTGTLSDLVCSPFVVSYDTIECCIQFECPLQLENVSYNFTQLKDMKFLIEDEWMENECNKLYPL